MSFKFGKKIVASVFVTVLALGAHAQVRDAAELESMSSSAAEQFELLRVESAPIRSRAELDQYVQFVGLERTALAKLSESNRKLFLDSLTFNEKGLTGLNYAVLENELTPTDIYRLTDLFGASRLTFMMLNAKPVSALDRLLLKKGVQQAGDGQQKYVTSEKCQDESSEGGCGGTDYQNYWCSSRATCSPQMSSICMSSC